MRWLFRIAGTLVLLLFLASGMFFVVPTERIARLAADRFEATTGRALLIEGPVRATLWPRLGIRAEGVTVAAPGWAGKAPLLQADALEIGVAPELLWGGALRIATLRGEGAVVTLVRGADGRGSWEFGDGGGEGGALVPVERAVLSGSTIHWEDRTGGPSATLRAVDAVATLPDPGGALTLETSALVGGRSVALLARLPEAAVTPDGGLAPVEVTVTAGGTRLTLDGRANSYASAFEGRIKLTSTDGLAALDILGAAPDLPSGLGRERIEVTAALTLTPEGSAHLRDVVAALDGNGLSGVVDVVSGEERPRVAATLSAGTLDLPRFGGTDGDGGSSWDQTPIDVSGLFAVDADVTLATGAVTVDAVVLDELRARASLDRGRLVTTLQPLQAFGGTVTGDVVVNGRGGLSARADLDLSGTRMQPFLSAFAGFDRLIGPADASVRLLGVGNTVQALMGSLEGTVALRLGEGQIDGLDLAGMVRNLDPSHRGEGATTVFNEAALDLSVDGGVGAGMMSASSRLFTLTGEGQVGFGDRTLDWRLLPTLRDPEVTVPILVRGTWDEPEIRPDLEGLARQRLDEERQALEDRAQEEEARLRAEVDEKARAEAERLRARVAEELGVDPERLTDRDALEDAIRERVQGELIDLFLNR
jgi:AsmA protein